MLEQLTDAITAFLQQNNNPWGLGLLGLSALVEYVFPPFPGDTVTLFGAFLVVRYGWSLAWVFSAVMLGSTAGFVVDYAIGRRLARAYEEGRLARSEKVREQIERVLASFRRHGPAYVVINRFLPGVRAVIFVAAGMARLDARRVMLYALVSAAAWNALIVAAGYAVGSSWERIERLFHHYALAVWILLGLVAVVLVARGLLRRRP